MQWPCPLPSVDPSSPLVPGARKQKVIKCRCHSLGPTPFRLPPLPCHPSFPLLPFLPLSSSSPHISSPLLAVDCVRIRPYAIRQIHEITGRFAPSLSSPLDISLPIRYVPGRIRRFLLIQLKLKHCRLDVFNSQTRVYITL